MTRAWSILRVQLIGCQHASRWVVRAAEAVLQAKQTARQMAKEAAEAAARAAADSCAICGGEYIGQEEVCTLLSDTVEPLVLMTTCLHCYAH